MNLYKCLQKKKEINNKEKVNHKIVKCVMLELILLISFLGTCTDLAYSAWQL